MQLIVLLVAVLFIAVPAQATDYYIAPTGSDGNNGLTPNTPFLTFAYAINASRAWCGHRLILRNGTYGDGTSTGRLDVDSVFCTSNAPLTIIAENQRQAKIQGTNGTGKTIWIRNSDFIILDGVFAKNADNPSQTASENGLPIQVRSSVGITVRNSVFANVNRYGNNAIQGAYFSVDILFEDNEAYTFNRHCFTAWHSERVVVRRQYCNPRGGMLSGGVGPTVGAADSGMSMYPCKDCILENSIADGTTNGMYMNEMNSTFGSGILMSGSKLLGNICYNCRGNGVHINPRSSTDANHSPQDITVRDLVFYNHTGISSGMRVSDCISCTVDHITMIGGSSADGITFDDTDLGVSGASQSGSVTSSTISGMDRGYFVESGSYTGGFTGDYNNAISNTTNFSTGTWSNSTSNLTSFGTCKGAWPVDGSLLKGAGVGGSDQGATILYRYVDGILTTTPLWDPTTAAFPHGAADPDGINRVAGESLFDFHTRFNINAGGCLFPSGFTDPGGGGGGGGGPTDPATHVRTTNLSASHVQTISGASNRGLTVAVGVIWNSSGSPVYATGVLSSCGAESIPPISPAALYTDVTSGHRSLRIFGLINPTPGTCAITPTFSGSVSGGWVMESVQESNIGSYGTVATAVGSGTAPAVTSNTNSDETTRTFLATGTGVDLSAGPDQTLTTDYQHPSVSLRMASSTQDGADGQAETFVIGGTRAWAIAAVPIVPPAPGGPGSGTRTVTKYRIECGLGSEAAGCLLAVTNLQGLVSPNGIARIRAEVSGGVDTTQAWGADWYCRENGGSYYRVLDTFGPNGVKWIGPGFNPFIPPTGTSTTQQLSAGNFVAGGVKKDAVSTLTAPAMTASQKTELVGIFEFSAAVDTVVNCRPHIDSGMALDAYTVTPSITMVTPSAAMGF